MTESCFVKTEHCYAAKAFFTIVSTGEFLYVVQLCANTLLTAFHRGTVFIMQSAAEPVRTVV